jgi:alpha-D-ribose 1-methylphosphonate 5-triphosphate synthase subunit PhnG
VIEKTGVQDGICCSREKHKELSASYAELLKNKSTPGTFGYGDNTLSKAQLQVQEHSEGSTFEFTLGQQKKEEAEAAKDRRLQEASKMFSLGSSNGMSRKLVSCIRGACNLYQR